MSNSPFSYENPVMQMLITVGDLIILNFLFLLCSLPVFTIGAAQAGMYTAMRVMRDKEDDSSLVAAFFRGFRNGFGKVTVAWGLMGLATLIVTAYCLLASSGEISSWLCIIPIVLIAWFTAQIPAIHSRFDCTPMQLIRNSWFLVIAHPLRTLGVTILTWFPLALLVFGVYFWGEFFTFFRLTPLWCVIYFSLAFLFSQTFLAKPFATMVEEFNNRQAASLDEAKEEV